MDTEKRDEHILAKRTRVNDLLEDEYVLVHVHPTANGVVLPPHLMGGESVTLKLSRFFRGSLEVGEEVIIADLLFGHAYFTCSIPFEAIWGMTSVSGENTLWTDGAVAKIFGGGFRKEAQKKAAVRSTPRIKDKKGHLRRVK